VSGGPRKPTAEEGINQKPVNERPSGQNISPSQSGTKNGDSGPAVEPANTATEAEVNPAEIAGETPFQGASQSVEPGFGESHGGDPGTGWDSATDGAIDEDLTGQLDDQIKAREPFRGPDGRYRSDPNRPTTSSTYDRVNLRESTKAAVRAAQPQDEDGNYIDPNTGKIIPKDGPFHYGHRPGFEYSRTRDRAQLEEWTRQRFIEYENEPSHYWIEDPYSNMSHLYEQR